MNRLVAGVVTLACLVPGLEATSPALATVEAASGTPGVEILAPGLKVTPTPPVSFRGRLYFVGQSASSGAELWSTDGTRTGTRLLADLTPGAGGSEPENLVVLKDRLYFTASVGGVGNEWWSTDGTGAGTSLFADINDEYDGASSRPASPVVVGDHLVFSADDGVRGREPWVLDGTPGGTRIAADVNVGPRSSDVDHLTALGDKALFNARTNNDTNRPWVLTPGIFGAERLDAEPMSESVQSADFTPVGDGAVFVGRVSRAGAELWFTRGIAGDARMVADIFPGESGSDISSLTRLGDRVLFAAYGPGQGKELWSSDGTLLGTSLVKDINDTRRSEPSNPQAFRVVGDEVFFTADDGLHGRELWATGGTTLSTRMIHDAYPGPASGVPEGAPGVVSLGRLVYLGADSRGEEPWISDGTARGTRQALGVIPGAGRGVARMLGVVGRRVVMYAYNAADDARAAARTARASSGGPDLISWVSVSSATTAKARKRYAAEQAKRKRIRVRVRVVDELGTAPRGGTVTLTRRGKVVGRATLVDGKARVRVRVRLAPGRRHRLMVSWSGSADAVGSERRVVIRVAKR